ncbi:unnamed protein product, partial [Prorocentrum cordatum]
PCWLSRVAPALGPLSAPLEIRPWTLTPSPMSARQEQDTVPGAPGPLTVGRCEVPGGGAEGRVLPRPVPECPGTARPRRLSMEPAAGSSTRMHAVPAIVGVKLLSNAFSYGDEYRLSREVDRYHEFWSYSRHASPFMNCISLLMYYNCWQAFLASVAAATATALLLQGEVCPAELSVSGYRAGLPCMAAGLCTSVVVMFAWPSRQRVFLDRACIPQDDETAKRNGILSLGYYLRMSRTVLVLWDNTYFRRLWCVFEFAACTHLQSDREQASDNALQVLPSIYGGILAILFVGLTVFNFVTRWFLIGVDDLPSMFGALPHHEIL